MEDSHIFRSIITWTRTIVLILSIIVVVISLTVYNCNSLPIYTLLEEETTGSIALPGRQIIYDMIQDRRLIATLVAAQGSIFCPLFLLMSSSSTTLSAFSTTTDIWRAVTEKFCQFLMPLGLVMSWFFCIAFDKHTHIALVDYYTDQQSNWIRCGIYVANGLKHTILLVLMLEVLTIWASSFKYALALIRSQKQIIRLSDKEEGLDHIGIDYEEEEDKMMFV